MKTNQKPARVRPMQIIDAAVQVIMERGLAETRISDIAERAGVSPALVLYYFESKDKVLTEALTFANERFYLRVSREALRLPSARDQLIRLIELSCPGGDGNAEGEWDDEYILWIELWNRALRDPEMAKDREALERRWRTIIVDIVRKGQDQGEFPPGDPEEAALRLSALIDGLSIMILLRDPEVTPDRMRQACLEVAAHEIGFDLPERVVQAKA